MVYWLLVRNIFEVWIKKHYLQAQDVDQDEVLFDWAWEREKDRLEEWENISELTNTPEDHEMVVKFAEDKNFAMLWLMF